jgi:hypothetical protein
LALVTWPVAWAAALTGGGLDEPYATWHAYLHDTKGTSIGLLILTFFPCGALSLCLWAIGQTTKVRTRSVMCRTFSLGAVPVLVPLLALVPFQIVDRSVDQIFPPPLTVPNYGSDWFLLAIIAGWCWMMIHAWRVVHRQARWVATGCCAVCGYDLRDTPTACPECGAVPQR